MNKFWNVLGDVNRFATCAAIFAMSFSFYQCTDFRDVISGIFSGMLITAAILTRSDKP